MKHELIKFSDMERLDKSNLLKDQLEKSKEIVDYTLMKLSVDFKNLPEREIRETEFLEILKGEYLQVRECIRHLKKNGIDTSSYRMRLDKIAGEKNITSWEEYFNIIPKFSLEGIGECFDLAEIVKRIGCSILSLGRSNNADIQISNPQISDLDSTVSKEHAFLEYCVDGFDIEDDCSKNGTYIIRGDNLKQRLPYKERISLQDKDKLYFGELGPFTFKITED